MDVSSFHRLTAAGTSVRFLLCGRRLLPASLLAGATFLVLCASIGRILLPGMEIRVGIMTAFIGTPYFLYLLRRRVKLEG